MNERKKVLSVITKGNFGGAQRYVYDLATHLPKEQFDVAVVCGEGETLKNKLVEADIRTIQIDSMKRDVGMFSDIRSFFALWKIFRNEKPDVVHLNSSKAGGLGVVAARLAGVKRVIFTGHAWAFNEDRNFVAKLIIYKIYWWIIFLSHKTIAVSERTADQVSWMPFLKKKIVVVYNGVEAFDLFSRDAAQKALIPSHIMREWIGTLSELHRVKGLDLAIRAFAEVAKKYANVGFVIVGGGDEEKNLRDLADELGVGDKVVFTGFVADARRYLRAFDIFTLTSRSEALPYAPLEAGLATLPVVASWVGGIPEIIENNVSGILVDPHDTEALTKALEDLITSPELRAKYGNALHKTVETTFALKEMVSRTIALY